MSNIIKLSSLGLFLSLSTASVWAMEEGPQNFRARLRQSHSAPVLSWEERALNEKAHARDLAVEIDKLIPEEERLALETQVPSPLPSAQFLDVLARVPEEKYQHYATKLLGLIQKTSQEERSTVLAAIYLHTNRAIVDKAIDSFL